MRTPSTVNNNHLSSHQLNQFNFNEYSVTELQELTRIQQEQIKQNQQLLRMREQRLKSLEQQQNNYENQQLKMFKQEETKSIRLKNLQNQLNTQATFGNQLELLKQIYLNKEQELNNSLSKLDESTKQLDQIRKLKLIVNNDQKEDKNQLEKLKQELMIRTNLNEQQSRQIIYQRQIFAAKQNELNQLDQRIEQLQQTKKSSKANDFRSALNSVQDTLNKINIAQIEKQMLQLAKSFDSIPTKKVNNSSKIAFASKSEIAATYMTQPVMSNQQSLPAKLRLNDDILSVHYNNITSNIKKRHSISDLIEQPVDIQVRDDTIVVEQAKEIFIEHPQLLNVSEDEDDDDDEEPKTIMESYVSDTESEGSVSDDIHSVVSFSTALPLPNLKSLLKTATTPRNTSRRVVFNPLALLLDAAVLGELDLLIKSAKEVKNPSEPNDEGLTALHNAVCSSNFECIQFLVEFGCNINYADNDGWTPLHCAASCNSISIVKFLIEHGACVYATTFRDNETAADKCEEEEDDYASCYEYLRNIENDLGVINDGLVYGLYDYESDCQTNDELEFKTNDQLIILRRGDETECQWWWARHQTANKEGYVPRNYLGLYPRVKNNSNVLTDK